MQINNKKMMDLAKQYGFDASLEDSESTEELAERYVGKSDDELIREMLKLKKDMKADPLKFRAQLAAIKSMKAMLNTEQKEKLDRIIKMLEQD